MSNETAVIVVIGSVTAKQYKNARLECLAFGWKPEIVRVHESAFPTDWTGSLDEAEVALRSGISEYEMEHYEEFGAQRDDIVREELKRDYDGLDAYRVEYVVLSAEVGSKFDHDFHSLREIFPVARITVAAAS